MAMNNANEPAFPFIESNNIDQSVTPGLTKREIFAAMAMQGIISSTTANPLSIAESAVRYADALLSALNSQLSNTK